jgi:signal transduction histidine kinase
MEFLRNKEAKRTLFLFVFLSAVASGIAFGWNVGFGWFTLVLCALFFSVWFFSTRKRYRRLKELSCDIDGILHGQNRISLKEYSEGELAILQTEINKMTLRLAEQQQQLQTDKLQLADSIADISHQIRTPLTTVNLLLSEINNTSTTPEERSRLVRELSNQLARIDWLITALLKISKLDAGAVLFKTEQISLEKLVEVSVSSLIIPFELRSQTLSVTAEGSFLGDPSWTAEAITNVVKNCMEHTPCGGTVTVVAEENPLYCEIAVSDTGSGISEEDMPHIFERFYKGKNSDKNSFGVGLALARKIAMAQNGTIKAENLPEGGAKFTLSFYKSTI